MKLVQAVLSLAVYTVGQASIIPRQAGECPEATEAQLLALLGPAYNSRYMSVSPPPPVEDGRLPFAVEEGYRRDLPDRQKRSQPLPWGCTAREVWRDLGEDRFPRYLRSLDCGKEDNKCWYGHFTCRPQAFTLSLLRRSGGCGQNYLPLDDNSGNNTLDQYWTWEERAVTFACQCAR